MNAIKLYVAGRVQANDVFTTFAWRDEFCALISRISGREIINLDPTKGRGKGAFDESDTKLIFGRDCYMIQQADVVIVYLTDDISVGGSQEMIIAKYFKKPLIGIAQKEGKFIKTEYENFGTRIKNWVHPFVGETCDVLVNTPEEAAAAVNKVMDPHFSVKDERVINESIKYFVENHKGNDPFLRDLL